MDFFYVPSWDNFYYGPVYLLFFTSFCFFFGWNAIKAFIQIWYRTKEISPFSAFVQPFTQFIIILFLKYTIVIGDWLFIPKTAILIGIIARMWHDRMIIILGKNKIHPTSHPPA